MGKYYKWKVLLIIGLVAGSIWCFWPPQEKIHLGLDLQGGMQILLQVDLAKLPIEAQKDATERVTQIIRNRIDEFGVKEPIITRQGKDQVVVQLPGVTDRDRAKEIVEKTAHLEFKLVVDDPEKLKGIEAGTIPPEYEANEMKNEMGGSETIYLIKEAPLTGDHLTNASVGFDQYGQPIVHLQLDKDGAKMFDKITFQNVGKRLAIVLDGKVHSAPVIRDRIPNGQAQISGNFTNAEASDLALVLRAGALPAPVNVIEERTVGPSLGRDSIESGVKAGIVGALLVFIFMPLYYFIPGLIADLGLVVYGIIVVGAMALLKSSLTMPGIAGFILSIGMAVDANVLISERMREEYETGKTVRAAIAAGYHKAFAAIFDSNATTLLTSLVLFIFGTGPVKGFAVTLSIGLVACMFSSLFVTRVIFDFLAKQNPNLNLKMMKLIGVTKIPFLKGRLWAYGFSVLTIAIGITAFALRGKGNYAVEFTGGTSIQMKFQKSVDVGQLRKALEKQGIAGLMIQRYGEESENQFVIRTAETKTDKIEQVATALAGKDQYKILKVDQVGPTVSQDLRSKALMAVFWSSIGLLVYLGYRFEWKFALASVIMLMHDVGFTFGMYALSNREISLPTIAGILTIMGFSVNDTVITFDRVRENLRIMRKISYKDLIELSINQTLGRTILTTFTTLLASFALFVFGGSSSIRDFAFLLLVGFSIGVYSTVFVASALVVDWTRKPVVVKAVSKPAASVKKR
jgi:SecD/SecF fusion protein